MWGLPGDFLRANPRGRSSQGFASEGLPEENLEGALTLPNSTVSAPKALSWGDSYSSLPRGFSTVAQSTKIMRFAGKWSQTNKAFDLIQLLRARPRYQLSSGWTASPAALQFNAHSTKAPINLPVNKNKDFDFYGIVKVLPKFSIMTSYLGMVISVCWIFCAN